MATFTISVGALSKDKTLTNAQVTRFITAYKSAYNIPVEATNAEVFDLFSEGVFRGIKNVILQYEENERARIAKEAEVALDF